MYFEFNVNGGDFVNAGYASSQVKKTLKEAGVEPSVIRRVVIALYEAEVNIVAHAHKGIIKVDIEKDGIKMVLEDEGPGIADIQQAMQKGFSTASESVREMGFGAGMGLPNISENSDNFSIKSEVGKGTVLDIFIRFN